MHRLLAIYCVYILVSVLPVGAERNLTIADIRTAAVEGKCAQFLAPGPQIECASLRAFFAAHPNLSEKSKNAIIHQKIFIGMSAVEVTASWEKPMRVNTSVGSWGEREQWVYWDGKVFLYFEDGQLTSWQTTK